MDDGLTENAQGGASLGHIAPAADAMFAYVRDMIYDPPAATLSPENLPGEFAGLGQGLEYLFQIVSETRSLAKELAKGNLNCNLPQPTNEIAAPLKSLHASLKHLTWQAQQVAKGDYSQRVAFMGDFSAAFNNMVEQLEDRRKISLAEKEEQYKTIENLNTDLKTALITAEAANQAKTVFLANMSHEMRTPMNAIMGIADIMRHNEALPEDMAEGLDKIYNSCALLLDIVNDILDFSKIEAGKMDITPEGDSPADLISDSIRLKLENLRQCRLNGITDKKRAKITREPMPYGSALVVDDVETNLYVAAGLLKPYRLRIDTAMNGAEAVGKIENGGEYDVIFMDHMMPEMDGMEAAKYLRGKGYAGPIIALTANAVAGQGEIFLQNGFDAFIPKPIDIRLLDDALNKFIRDKQPPEVIEAARRQAADKQANDDGGDPQMDSTLLESFVRDARKAIATLEEMHTGGFENCEDLRKFTISVHGMKSSLANIGEKQLSETALKLEQAGKERNTALIADFVPGFLDKLRTLSEKHEPNRTECAVAENIAELCEKLTAAQETCKHYNRKGTLDILREITRGSCSKETMAAIDNITELVQNSDFEDAEDAAAAYIRVLRQAD